MILKFQRNYFLSADFSVVISYVQQNQKKPHSPADKNQNNLQSNFFVNICQAGLRVLNVCVNGNRVNRWRQLSLRQNLVFNQHVSKHFEFWGYARYNISVPLVQLVL